jgi:hypothetical protein
VSEFAAATSSQGALAKITSILQRHLDGAGPNESGAKATIPLGALSDLMEERAFGLLLLVLALPCSLPFVYVLPQLVALPMLLLSVQMASGRRAPWLPETLRKRTLPVAALLGVVVRAKRYGGWLERLAHPRLASLTRDRATRVIGMLLIVPCMSILLPLPLTNSAPALGIALTAAGLVERDGLFVILGLMIATIWIVILVIGGPALLYFLINSVLAR